MKSFLVGLWSKDAIFRALVGGMGLAIQQGMINLGAHTETIGTILVVVALAITAGDKNTDMKSLKKQLKDIK